MQGQRRSGLRRMLERRTVPSTWAIPLFPVPAESGTGPPLPDTSTPPVLVEGTVQAAIGIVSYSLRTDMAQYVPSLLRAAEGLARRLEDALGNAYPSISEPISEHGANGTDPMPAL